MKNKIKLVKVILSILLLICLFDMPYGYYTLVRFISFAVFGYMAYDALKEKKNEIAIVYGALALLFQPFFKIALGRAIWNVVDVIVAVMLIVSIFAAKQNNK